MPSPKEVIENIRKIRFGKGLDTKNLSDDQKAALIDKEKILKDAAQLASEINTKNPHFIFELIQNAEDNNYEQSEAPMIKFIIQSDRLIIQNNEKGFQEENVWALCGVGESTKKNALGYIGEKGIGFKSVFKISDEPHIYSNGFRFEFIHNPEEPESIIIPHWVNTIHHLNVDPTQTNIVLPLKPKAKSEIKQYIDQIHPSLLLFLRKVKIIEIEDNIQHTHEKIKRYDHNGQIEIEHGEKKSYWRAIKKTLEEIPEHINEERRKDIRETEIILAFPLSGDGSADASIEQDVFAFLPVRRYGFKFIIQADFLLHATRENIIDNEWNEWLRDSIVLAFIDAINEFKVDKKLRYTFYNYLPLKEEVKDDFFLPVVEQIYKELQNIECVLTETNQWKKPSDVLIGDKEIGKLVSNEDLTNFFDKEYLSTEIKAKKPILRLGVEDFSIDNLIKCLENTEWVKKQDDDWLAFLYEYLSKQKLSDAQLKQLKGLDVIRLENNELTSIYAEEYTSEYITSEDIFFPLDKKGKDYGFENELRIIKGNIIDIISERERQEKNLKILEFLEELGIRSPNPYEIIEDTIMPIFYSIRDEGMRKDSATLFGYVKYIKDNIKAYEKNPLGYGLCGLLIRVDKSAEGTIGYEHPEDIYLPKSYGNKNDLETLFEGIDVNFVHPCYIEEVPRESTEFEQQRDDIIKEWRDFFIELGVNAVLIVKKDPKTEIYEGPDYAKNKVTKKKILKREKEKTVWKDCNWEDTDWRGYYIQNDWISKDFDRIIGKLEELNEDAKSDICKQLAGIIDANWENFKKYKSCKYYYRYFNQSGWNSAETPSTFLLTLKKIGWLPTTQNTLVKPSQIFLNKPEIQEVLGDTVPYLAVEIKNEDFIKTLGINTEASVKNVLNYLKALVEQGCDDKSKFNRLYEFLNKHFDEDKSSIRHAFSANHLIYIPDASKKFFKKHDVIWKDVSVIFRGNRGYLEGHYPDLKDFFVDKLGVREKPLPKDYADVLKVLSQKEKIIGEDEQIILKIYEKLNYHLNPENNEHLISREDWWKGFVSEPIFWTDKEKWKNDDDVFVNDDEVLYKLFKDNPRLAFLKLPKNYHPNKIQHFIKAVDVPYLSKVETKLATDETARIEQNLTEQIRKFAPYILRYLYQLEHDRYKRLKSEGILTQLKNLTCCSIENLQVEYILNQQSAFTQRNAFLYNEKLYIQNDRLEDTDYLAVELSKLFGELKGLDGFLISLFDKFDKKTDDKIGNLLRAKGIQELPEEEQKWFGIEEEALKEKEEKKKEKEECGQDQERSGTVKVSKTSGEKEEKEEQEKEKEECGQDQERSGTGKVSEKSGDAEEKEEQEKEKEERGQDKERSGTGELGRWQPVCKPEEAEISFKQRQHERKKLPDEEEKIPGSMSLEESARKETKKREKEPNEFDALSYEDKKAIGKWGEKCVFNGYLRYLLGDKYLGGDLDETENGFTISLNGEIVVEARWLNKTEDKGVGYDIIVIEKGDENYIEVKSTKTDKKEWFELSRKQWEFAQEKGDKYHIFRVYNAGTKQVKVVDIPNPSKLWQEGGLIAYPIRVQI